MSMKDVQATTTVEAGALARRHVRAKIDALGLEANEHKGLIESTFVVRGPYEQITKLQRWAAAYSQENDA